MPHLSANRSPATGQGSPDRPLAGIRVVDLLWGPMAPAGRYLVELGAQVDRLLPPMAKPLSPSAQIRDKVAHIGKTLHPHAPDSPEAAALLAQAHLVLTDQPLDTQALLAANPTQVILDVTPFGRGNPYSHWQTSDAVLQALGGELARSGIRGREPLLVPGELAYECAASQAVYAALQSLFFALRTGQGDCIDFSILDGAMQTLDPGYSIGGSASNGRPAAQLSRERPPVGVQYPILPCADGHVRLCVLAPRQWQGLFKWMGSPEAFADPSFNRIATRQKSTELLQAIAAHFAPKTRATLEAEAAHFGVPLSGVVHLRETPASPHFVARGAFRTEIVNGQPIPLPNGLFLIDNHRQPPVGATHHPDIAYAQTPHDRPFSGLKVVDMGVIVVGAEAGRMLADQGADVIKVESRSFPDGSRQSYLPYGLSAGFAVGHRNKRAIGLDLRTEAGKALFLKLLAEADILLSNFKPGTLESLGLSDALLAQHNPRLIRVESSAYGDSGPWRTRGGYGPLVRAATGLTQAWRYADDPTSFSDSLTIYPDHVGGRFSAIAAIALLIRRHRTGQGGKASIAQTEIALAHYANAIAHLACGIEMETENAQVYPCAGTDEWCVVTLRDRDAEKLQTLTDGRDLADWLRTQPADVAMERLQALGIAAGQMLRVADLPGFGYGQARHLFRAENHPYLVETIVGETLYSPSRHLRAPDQRPAPLMGEHSLEILQDWLGLAPPELEALLAARTIEVACPDERARIEQALAAEKTA